jgi:hypothetical protein
MIRLKSLAVVLLLAVLAGCAARPAPPPPPPPPTSQDWTVTIRWDFDFTNYPPCTAARTTSCVTSFTWGYEVGTAQTPLHTLPVSPTASGALTGITDTANSLLPLGVVRFFCAANFVDQAGAAQTVTSTTGTAGQGPDSTVPLAGVKNIAVGLS